MKRNPKKQLPAPTEEEKKTVRVKMILLDVSHDHLANRMAREVNSISEALSGKNKTLFWRIDRYLTYRERKAAERANVSRSMAHASETLRSIAERSAQVN